MHKVDIIQVQLYAKQAIRCSTQLRFKTLSIEDSLFIDHFAYRIFPILCILAKPMIKRAIQMSKQTINLRYLLTLLCTAPLKPFLLATGHLFQFSLFHLILSSNLGYLTFYVGSAAYPAENGMLGAASNEIRMSNGPTLVFCGSSAVVPSCSRTVRGRGTLTARNGDNKMALALGSAAVLAPCGDNDAGYGTMAVAATTLADDAGTTYAIDIDATDTAVADVLDFTGSSFERLNGRFTVTPSDETVKIPIGATWTIGKLPSGFSADVRFVSGNKNFTVHSAENESGEMVIVAERRQAGTMIIVR